MARLPRIVVPGCPHHVTHRGNHGERVFLSADGRRHCREWLHGYAVAEGLQVLAYCLMTNHVHLIVIPERKESLARVAAARAALSVGEHPTGAHRPSLGESLLLHASR